MNYIEKDKNYLSLLNIMKIAMLAILFAFLITRTILPTKVTGNSMGPTLIDGTYTLINKINKNIKTGDIVVFHIYDKEYLVKRVIAMEGDRFEIKDEEVYVNAFKLDEPYVKEEWHGGSYSGVIPEGHIFVMGDNRNVSIDSRNIGAIKKETILGKVLFK